MATGGFFHKPEFRPDAVRYSSFFTYPFVWWVFLIILFKSQPFRIFNTWMGDPNKLILLREVIKIIEQDQLVEKTHNVGKELMKGLMHLEVRLDK